MARCFLRPLKVESGFAQSFDQRDIFRFIKKLADAARNPWTYFIHLLHFFFRRLRRSSHRTEMLRLRKWAVRSPTINAQPPFRSHTHRQFLEFSI